jgi:hypothetical protein
LATAFSNVLSSSRVHTATAVVAAAELIVWSVSDSVELPDDGWSTELVCGGGLD